MGKIMQGEKKLCSIEKGSPALGVAAREGSGGASPEEGWGRKGTRAPRTPPLQRDPSLQCTWRKVGFFCPC